MLLDSAVAYPRRLAADIRAARTRRSRRCGRAGWRSPTLDVERRIDELIGRLQLRRSRRNRGPSRPERLEIAQLHAIERREIAPLVEAGFGARDVRRLPTRRIEQERLAQPVAIEPVQRVRVRRQQTTRSQTAAAPTNVYRITMGRLCSRRVRSIARTGWNRSVQPPASLLRQT